MGMFCGLESLISAACVERCVWQFFYFSALTDSCFQVTLIRNCITPFALLMLGFYSSKGDCDAFVLPSGHTLPSDMSLFSSVFDDDKRDLMMVAKCEWVGCCGFWSVPWSIRDTCGGDAAADFAACRWSLSIAMHRSAARHSLPLLVCPLSAFPARALGRSSRNPWS